MLRNHTQFIQKLGTGFSAVATLLCHGVWQEAYAGQTLHSFHLCNETLESKRVQLAIQARGLLQRADNVVSLKIPRQVWRGCH